MAMDMSMAQTDAATLDRPQSLSRVDLAALAAGVAVAKSARYYALGCETELGVVTINSRLTEPAVHAVEHFALESALWQRLDPRPDAEVRLAHALAAAHATAAFIDLHPRLEAEAMKADIPVALVRLMAAARKANRPEDLGAVLEEADIVEGAAGLAAGAWREFERVRPLALPVQALMLEAGDNRLALDPDSGCNRYGGSPFPRTDVAEFSSSTATDLSLLALEAAEAQRQALMAATVRGELRRATRTAAAAVKSDLLAALGLEDDGRVVPVLASSGTTAMLFATHLGLAGDGRPALALIIGPDETGRGVPAAILGRHAAPTCPSGIAVQQNGEVAGMPPGMRIERLAIRNAQGRAVPADSLVEPIAGIIARERAANRRVILHVVEGSKTGLVAPGISSVLLLRRWFPDLPIVVDACQLRTGMAVLRRYLAAGCMVAVSGSKFFGGPPFSGALLVPAGLLETMGSLPAGFADYSWRSDWPTDEGDERFAMLPETGNAGLLLRWRGALAEIEAFAALPAAKVSSVIEEIGRAVRTALLATPDAVLLPAVPATGSDSESWTSRPSIFTFAVRGINTGWLDEASLRRLHMELASDVSDRLPSDADSEQRRLAARICHIGQPVAFAQGPYPAGLRIAIGARRILGSLSPAGLDRLQSDLDDVVAKLGLLLRLPKAH